MIDQRSDIYASLHKDHVRDETVRIHSAERVLRTLFDRFAPASLLDVGCGVGLWLAVAEKLGVPDLKGIEGPWVQNAEIRTSRSNLIIRDLEQGFNLDRRFGLVISIEVAEHLSPAAADLFVASLTRHADLVLFSAAIPGQGGTGHLNEQFPDYWAARFACLGYSPIDFVRRALWADRSIHVWLRQNVIPFASARFLAHHAWARHFAEDHGPLSIVHPELFSAVHRTRQPD